MTKIENSTRIPSTLNFWVHSGVYRISGSQITLVLDGSYGRRATEDAKRGPMWIVDSPKNADVAEELWRLYKGHGDYITIFDPHGHSAEEQCMNIIPDVYSHHHNLLELTVVGVSITPQIQSFLGKGMLREAEDGFVFLRSTDALTS